MADETIQLPTEGSGPFVYVIGTDRIVAGGTTKHILVTQVGDADYDTYDAAVIGSAAAANKNHIVLFNGTGSAKKIRIKEIYAFPHLTATVATPSAITLQVIGVGQTGTGGTAGVIRTYDTSDPALPVQITSNLAPTVLTIPADHEIAGGTIFVDDDVLTGPSRSILYQKVGNIGSLILNDGQGIVVRQTALAGVGAVTIHIVFTVD